ncbi:hypothetical protein AGMMS49975_08420 [Clostridia bacterium]|nr:hypothetical protein AGMMS49975_08420 [Clostridia bacterium]
MTIKSQAAFFVRQGGDAMAFKDVIDYMENPYKAKETKKL